MASLLDDFAAAVRRHRDRIAIVDGKGRETSFAELQAKAAGFARAWQDQGIGKGDRVLLAMHLDADLYASLAALWSLGATVVLPEPAMGVAGLRHAAKVNGVVAFCSSGLYGALKFVLPELWHLRHLRPRAARTGLQSRTPPSNTDIALISFTSGTTGAPKAIPRSHGFLSAQHAATAPLLHSEAAERDLVAFPVFVLINIASGRTSVLPNWKMSRLAQLDPASLAQWIKDQKVSRALLPPSICEKLADSQVPRSLHTIFTGGGPVFPHALDAMRSAKSELEVICVYGSTEAEPIAHLDARAVTDADRMKMKGGHGLLVGQPVPGLRVRIVDDEIQVAGTHVNTGYLDPEQDKLNKVRDGTVIWHRTGDAGYFDDTGRLWLLGRTGSQANVSGRFVYPFSIEVAVHGWAGVKRCAMMATRAGACLVIEGDQDRMSEWSRQAAELGVPEVKAIDRLPMDRRHQSKVDRASLLKLIS